MLVKYRVVLFRLALDVTVTNYFEQENSRSVAAVVSCYCVIIVAAVIVLGLGALFLLFVLLYSQRVASHSCETLRQLLHDPKIQEACYVIYRSGEE